MAGTTHIDPSLSSYGSWPGISPSRYRSATRSSKPRMTSIWRAISTRSSRDTEG